MQAGLSEEALAEAVGISSVTLHLYETGLVDPSSHLDRIAAATGQAPSFFLETEMLEPEAAAQAEPEPPSPPAADEGESAPYSGTSVSAPQALPQSPTEERRRLEQAEERLRRKLEELESLAQALAAREQALSARATALSEQEAALAEREAELSAREAALEARYVGRETGAGDLPPRGEDDSAQRAESAAHGDGERHEEPSAEMPAAVERPLARLLPLRTGGALAASLDLSGLDRIASLHQIGGTSVIAETRDGRQIRVTAVRDDDTGAFSPVYEEARVHRWHDREILVWEQAPGYRCDAMASVEECLEAALAEIDSGGTAEPEGAAQPLEEPELAHVPSEEPPRRGILAWFRRRAS